MIVLFYSNMFPSCGQQTIEVAKLFCVTLFFEEPIGKYDIENAGTRHIQVKKDSEKSIVTLTVNPNSEVGKHKSNITIIADRGNIYAYLLEVVKKPSRLNVMVKVEDAVFNLKKTDNKNSKNIGPTYKIYENKRTKEEYYERKVFNHMHNMLQNPIFYRFNRKNIKGSLFLNDIKRTKSKFYLFLKQENRGDFDIKNVRMRIASKETEESISKKNEIEPIYYYELPKRVVGRGREQHFALVFKTFAIENKETLYHLHINEFNKDQSVQLIIDGKEMNKAKRF